MIGALTSLERRTFPPPKIGKLGDGIWVSAMESTMRSSDLTAATIPIFSLLPISASAFPVQGWPFSCFGCQKEAAWARGMAREVVYSNTILTQLYPSLSAQSLADPAAARAAVQAAWKRLPQQTILSAWRQAGQQVRGAINFDFSGSQPAPVHFLISNNDFQAGPNGWKWSKVGVVWFGDGAISGKQVSLALQSAVDKSQSQSSGMGSSTSGGLERSAGGVAGVK
jgi:hypothetical protein